MTTANKSRCAQRKSDGCWQVAVLGLPPAVVFESFDDAVSFAVKVSSRSDQRLPRFLDDGAAEVSGADAAAWVERIQSAQDHIDELLYLGMTRAHIIRAAGISRAALDKVVCGDTYVSPDAVEAVLKVDFELTDMEAHSIDVEHLMSMGYTATEAVRWCASRAGKPVHEISNSTSLISLRRRETSCGQLNA